MPPEMPGPAALADILPVSRETADRLATYVRLVEKWQKVENLIAAGTVGDMWRRHVADCAQLVPLLPAASRWLDLGSGGGFPGLVVAILVAGRPDAMVHLVESNTRKCSFLRTVARETGAPAVVHQGRIADVLAGWSTPVDALTARALAPLPELLRMTGGLIGPGRPALFLKGADYRSEIDEAAQSFDLDLVIHPSRVADGSVILEVRRATRIPGGAKSRP